MFATSALKEYAAALELVKIFADLLNSLLIEQAAVITYLSEELQS